LVLSVEKIKSAEVMTFVVTLDIVSLGSRFPRIHRIHLWNNGIPARRRAV
jgi:hypothetical protein